jgi:hypothetical protein
MNRYAQFKIFSMVYGIVYVICFYYNWALFRYYPVLEGFYRESQPPATAGPAILWYAWLIEAIPIAAIMALLVPRKLAERVPHAAVWVVPAAVVVGILVYERRWFL